MPKETKKTAEIKKTTASRKPVSAKAAAAKKKQEEMLYDLADLFKVFGDSTRIRILYALMDGSLCVSDISSELEMNQSAVSHQLRLLKQARLVKTRRDGKVRYYSLADEHIQKLFQVAFEHVLEE